MSLVLIASYPVVLAIALVAAIILFPRKKRRKRLKKILKLIL